MPRIRILIFPFDWIRMLSPDLYFYIFVTKSKRVDYENILNKYIPRNICHRFQLSCWTADRIHGRCMRGRCGLSGRRYGIHGRCLRGRCGLYGRRYRIHGRCLRRRCGLYGRRYPSSPYLLHLNIRNRNCNCCQE